MGRLNRFTAWVPTQRTHPSVARAPERRRAPRLDDPGGGPGPIRFEVFGPARLRQLATGLARAQKTGPAAPRRELLPRVRENARLLRTAYRAVVAAVGEGRAITQAAEWLLDNIHTIEAQIGGIESDLPDGYYRGLPRLAAGPLAGYPRVYGLAWAWIAHTDSRFSAQSLAGFVRAYQTVEPLRLGELWAVPITLRVVLVENLRRLAVRVLRGLKADPAPSARWQRAAENADNLTARHIITSMKAIAAFEWPRFVEDVSVVDECLRAHVGYAEMDFATRDRYRHAIENLARNSPHTELEIACRVGERVERAADPRAQEPGYYLIGPGRYGFEREVGFRPSPKQRFLRAYVAQAWPIYLGSATVLALAALVPFWSAAHAAALAGVFALFPAMDIAMGLLNRFILLGLPPAHLPRLEFERGVPEDRATCVAVPTLFLNAQGVREQIAQLEIHCLANPGGAVYFALLSDWADADRETLPEDGPLLRLALDGVAALNAKYGARRFFVFHRRRLWNPAEGRWMGWERKRGKLHEFNRLLRGAADTSFLDPDGAPPGVRYVLTLDADTQLPMGVVAALVGVAAHPLNRPVFDPVARRVVEGYAIFQPRVTPALPGRRERSLFHRVFAGASGLDAYSSSASELYQDLFGSGTYSGKGLYEIDSFEAALAGRVPDNTLLSHDLFESVFARCALVGDISLFEEYPSHVGVAALREHRWARGDWQLLPWICGSRRHGVPLAGRWKMLDNLRRSLSAPGAFATLVAAWAVPGMPVAWALGLVLAALGLPALLAVVNGFGPPPPDVPLAIHLRAKAGAVWLETARGFFGLVLLAQRAGLMLDAVGRSLWRLYVSRRHLLRWVTALEAKMAAGRGPKECLLPMALSSATVGGIAALVWWSDPARLGLAAPFLLLWWLAPLVAHGLGRPPRPDRAELPDPQAIARLRRVARRTWRFFTTFVTAAGNHLPPDNFQEIPEPVVAQRGSPTNFGLYLLSVAAARDFGWLGLADALDRLEASLDTLDRLPRLNGHFYNWYDTRALDVLEPRFVSTVDSGNLAGHLLTLAALCREWAARPLDLPTALKGLADTRHLLDSALDLVPASAPLAELRRKCAEFGALLERPPTVAEDWHRLWGQLPARAEGLLESAQALADGQGGVEAREVLAWAEALREDVRSHLRDIDGFLPWIGWAGHPDAGPLEHLALATPLGELAPAYALALAGLRGPWAVAALLRRAGERAAELARRLERLAVRLEALFQGMDFRCLYDGERNLFSLGYQVAADRLDPSYYDLLASEARLASFIAIAKHEVPAAHWLRLGRRMVHTRRGGVLLSWSGSMFEYLMPALVGYAPRYSLLDRTCRRAVARQIDHGRQLGIPWGVSESACNGRDAQGTYQYSAFGVPDLGMKRGLGRDWVVAPYATALAAMYYPKAAALNYDRLADLGAEGRYGFYEALDFTPSRLGAGQRFAPVRCYMAHHQGMTLVALANAVHDGTMRHRFHSVPRVRAAALLLAERCPDGAETRNPLPAEAVVSAQAVIRVGGGSG